MTDEEKAAGFDCLSVVLGLALLPPAVLYAGHVLTALWGWFVTPVFPGAGVPTVLQACGLSLVASYPTAGRAAKAEGESPLGIVLRWAFVVTVAWGAGFAIHAAQTAWPTF